MDALGERDRGVGGSTDADRFSALYDGTVRSIRAYCARRTAVDSVDDAVSETFLVAWRRIDDVPGGDGALRWLYRVADRVIGHDWRSTNRRRRLNERLRSVRRPSSVTPEESVLADDATRLVIDAAGRLGANDVEILRLHAWEQLSHADIGAVLGLTSNAVDQRLHRARKNLARQFGLLTAGIARAAVARDGGVSTETA